MRVIIIAILAPALLFTLGLAPAADSPSSQAPAAFDNKSNGLVDDATHQADQTTFEATEAIKDGLGPIYNAQSCRECHQTPVSGAASQVNELRVGHIGKHGEFENPMIPIARGKKSLPAARWSMTARFVPMEISQIPKSRNECRTRKPFVLSEFRSICWVTGSWRRSPTRRS